MMRPPGLDKASRGPRHTNPHSKAYRYHRSHQIAVTMTRRSRDRVDLVLHGREWLACLTQDNARSTRLARELQHDPSTKHRLFPADDWSRPRTAYRDAAATGRRSAGRCEDDIDHLGYARRPNAEQNSFATGQRSHHQR